MNTNQIKLLSRFGHMVSEAAALESKCLDNVIWSITRDGTNQATLHTRFDADPSVIDAFVHRVLNEQEPERMDRIGYAEGYQSELDRLLKVGETSDHIEECCDCKAVIEPREWRYLVRNQSERFVRCFECYIKAVEAGYIATDEVPDGDDDDGDQ